MSRFRGRAGGGSTPGRTLQRARSAAFEDEQQTPDLGQAVLAAGEVDRGQALVVAGAGVGTGGASAHYAWALLPDPLKITVLPAGTTDNPQGGWLASFTTVPRPRQPDDLTLLARRCEPDCASGKNDTFSLVWDPTFRLWELDQCTPEGEAPRRYHGVNGSVVDITYRGCPHFDMPGD